MSDDARRLAALRDSGMISHAEYVCLTAAEPPAAAATHPLPDPLARGHQSRSRLGQLAGTAAAAMAGVMAGQALERLLFDEAGAAADAATSAATEAAEQVDLYYSGSIGLLDTDGDGAVDAALEHETLIVDDGTPSEYTHTTYTEFVDSDSDGLTDDAVMYETHDSGEPAEGWSDDWDPGGLEA